MYTYISLYTEREEILNTFFIYKYVDVFTNCSILLKDILAAIPRSELNEIKE